MSHTEPLCRREGWEQRATLVGPGWQTAYDAREGPMLWARRLQDPQSNATLLMLRTERGHAPVQPQLPRRAQVRSVLQTYLLDDLAKLVLEYFEWCKAERDTTQRQPMTCCLVSVEAGSPRYVCLIHYNWFPPVLVARGCSGCELCGASYGFRHWDDSYGYGDPRCMCCKRFGCRNCIARTKTARGSPTYVCGDCVAPCRFCAPRARQTSLLPWVKRPRLAAPEAAAAAAAET